MYINLYEKVLKEEYLRTEQILDILQVFFLQAVSGENYTISTKQVIEFIREKLNVTLTFEEVREVLDQIAVVDSVDEEKITLFDPESMEAMEAETEFPGEAEEQSEEEKEEEKAQEEAKKEQDDMVADATKTAMNDLSSADKL